MNHMQSLCILIMKTAIYGHVRDCQMVHRRDGSPPNIDFRRDDSPPENNDATTYFTCLN